MTRVLRDVVRAWRRAQSLRKQRALGSLGQACIVHWQASFVFPQRIRIGDYCRIGQGCHLDGEGGLDIGDGTIFAPEVLVLTSTHRYRDSRHLPYSELDDHRAVRIGRGVWCGWGAKLVPGVTVGDGAVIAMGAVVAKDVPAGAVVAGNPAHTVAERDQDWVAQAVQERRYFLRAVKQEGLKRPGRKGTEFS